MVEYPIHLVGSIPGADAETVFRACGPVLGNRVAAMPDGETGTRRVWVVFLAFSVFDRHPDIESVSRPKPIGSIDNEWRRPDEDWVPSAFDDLWFFKVRDGVEKIHFDKLGYAEHAIASYQTFKRLKGEGVIAKPVRFMVCLPLPESATRWFVQGVRDYDIVTPAYNEVLRRELAEIVDAIPHDELCIQWDVCMEVIAVDVGDTLGRPPLAWRLPGTPLQRYESALAELSPLIPEGVTLGLHLCYGDLGHVHLIEPKDLRVCVEMANAGVAAAGRRIDFVHMPVPRERKDEAYFLPLNGLDTGATVIYLGLVHHTDGAAGTRARVKAAKHVLERFGIATECGFGRRPATQIPELLDIHCAVLDELAT
jgi:hypothetical protein